MTTVRDRSARCGVDRLRSLVNLVTLERVRTMEDARVIARARGARDYHVGANYDPPHWMPIEAQLMYAHAYRTGHKVCHCEVIHDGRDVNAHAVTVV